jgi:hypothetical protein
MRADGPSSHRSRNPITGIAGCCARAASGQAAAAPPSVAKNFVACHVTLRLGVIHAMEELYHASIARSVAKADRQVE